VETPGTRIVSESGSHPGSAITGIICQGWFLLPRSRELPLDPGSEGKFTEKLKADPTVLIGRKISKVMRTDG
jgi:hypothetical protein